MATHIPETWSTYPKQRNKVTQLIRNSFRDHYTGIVEKSKVDLTKIWKTINNVLTKIGNQRLFPTSKKMGKS